MFGDSGPPPAAAPPSRPAPPPLNLVPLTPRHACVRGDQVELKTTAQTLNSDVLQKAADFVHAFILGLWFGASQGPSGPSHWVAE